ncbi:hypothetical protein EDD15DRAFT_2200575 [Pisolithus albus]|nr:hypothetical protein EDD15DRAFT_2200575 [Pisolithus albus]
MSSTVLLAAGVFSILLASSCLRSSGSKNRSLPHSPVTSAIDEVDGESSWLGGSMWAVCDALRSTSSINHDISSVDDGFEALKRGLDIVSIFSPFAPRNHFIF